MKWLFNPTKITASGYCTFGNKTSQSGATVTNGFVYSPRINFPIGAFNLCQDEKGHYTRNYHIKTEIKFTVYDSRYIEESLGSVSYTFTTGIGYAYSSSNTASNPSGKVGYPDTAGNYYLQIDGQTLLNDLIANEIPINEELINLDDYPLHIEFACEVCGCRCEPDIITTTIEPNNAIYNAGYYYIPFSKPDHNTIYSSVRARVAVVPYCPHSIVEMRNYRDNIMVTASTDQQSQEITMDNAIVEFNTHETLYLKLSYNKMLNLVEKLIASAPGMVEEKIDRYGWAIQVQIFWYKQYDECESIGNIPYQHQTFKLQGSTHDISLYHGTTPVHKHYKAIPDARFDGENSLYVTWDANALQQTTSAPQELYIGLAIRNSVEYPRVLKTTKNGSERRARGRIRPKERVIWIQMAALDDEEVYIDDLQDIVTSNLSLIKKLEYFFSNWHDSYTYVRPVLGYYRPDCENGMGGPHWLCASDKSFLVYL